MLSNEENIDDENVDENVENILRMYILMIKFFHCAECGITSTQEYGIWKHRNREHEKTEEQFKDTTENTEEIFKDTTDY